MGVGCGQPVGALFTANICSTDIFQICVCFIFILITLLCYLVFFVIGKLVYRSFFPVFRGNTPVYSQFSIGGWGGGGYYITTSEPFCIDNVSFCLWWQGWYSCFLGSRLPFPVCGGSEKSLWRYEVIVGLGYTC